MQILALQSERENIRKRQAQGIAAAKARGVKFGRPMKPIPEDFGDLIAKWKRGELSVKDITRICGISEATFYRRYSEYRLVHPNKFK